MTILSNGHQWKYTEFVENKNYSFNKKEILSSLTLEEINNAYNLDYKRNVDFRDLASQIENVFGMLVNYIKETQSPDNKFIYETRAELPDNVPALLVKFPYSDTEYIIKNNPNLYSLEGRLDNLYGILEDAQLREEPNSKAEQVFLALYTILNYTKVNGHFAPDSVPKVKETTINEQAIRFPPPTIYDYLESEEDKQRITEHIENIPKINVNQEVDFYDPITLEDEKVYIKEFIEANPNNIVLVSDTVPPYYFFTSREAINEQKEISELYPCKETSENLIPKDENLMKNILLYNLRQLGFLQGNPICDISMYESAKNHKIFKVITLAQTYPSYSSKDLVDRAGRGEERVNVVGAFHCQEGQSASVSCLVIAQGVEAEVARGYKRKTKKSKKVKRKTPKKKKTNKRKPKRSKSKRRYSR